MLITLTLSLRIKGYAEYIESVILIVENTTIQHTTSPAP